MSDIIHQANENRFVVTKDGREAILAYSLNNGEIDFYSTFVPTEFRGQGIAEKLVRTGIAWAKDQGYKITASCWYAEKFLK